MRQPQCSHTYDSLTVSYSTKVTELSEVGEETLFDFLCFFFLAPFTIRDSNFVSVSRKCEFFGCMARKNKCTHGRCPSFIYHPFRITICVAGIYTGTIQSHAAQHDLFLSVARVGGSRRSPGWKSGQGSQETPCNHTKENSLRYRQGSRSCR